MNDLTNTEIDTIVSAEKFVDTKLVYRQKADRSHMETKGVIRCTDFPELNLTFRSIYHATREPRKFSFMLFLNGERFFALDVNPGGTHRNILTGESISGTHWHKAPTMDATPDTRDLNHIGWSNEFCKVTNLTLVQGYSAPNFKEEDKQQDLWEL